YLRMRKLALLLILFFGLFATSWAQFTPSLRCLFVKDEDNSVSLYFVPTQDSTNFLNYSVHYADNYDGPYTLLTSALTTCNTDCFDGLDPVVHNYYFIRSNFAGGVHYNSDTLATIHTTLVHGNGTAILSWNPDPYTPIPASSGTHYSVYCKNPNDFDFMYVGSVSATSPHTYTDTIGVCNHTVEYRVQLLNAWTNGTCRNSSTVALDVFQNTIPPATPTLTGVTVDYNTDVIQLSWLPSVETDVNKYLIFHAVTPNDQWIEVGSVDGRNNTTWTDPVNNSDAVHYYRISARDSCGNGGAMIEHYQSNMHLTRQVDVCHRKVKLTWTPYVNMTNQLQKYVIKAAVDGGALTNVGEVAANTLEFTHTGLEHEKEYCYVIQAVSSGGQYTTLSNKTCFLFEEEDRDDFVYVAAVSVVDNEDMKITINTNGDLFSFDQIELYRSEELFGDFVLIATIPFDGGAVYDYVDYDVKVNKKIYYYKALLYSECLPAPVISNTSNSILLTGTGDAAHRNQLVWFNYDDHTPLTSEPPAFILRKMETDNDFVEIVSNMVWASYNTYVDDVSELHMFGSDFKYKVGVSQSANQFGFVPPSFSNEVVIKQKPTIWIPNAFRPVGSKNSIFKPMNSFVSADTYIFEIYNRMGQLIFRTTNPNEGWDGRLSDGEYAPASVYVYKIQFIDNSDELFVTHGTVTVVY
ncbi:MAG TPA: gliding motility-associated C-terminal domain-containing protein, partial [Bacteroidales bacterium]|nr:gliding motility-associated C-terminal domain-containing protein [Bacteroidales bacterium]